MSNSNATTNFGGKFREEFEKAQQNIKKPSILVMGGTGVGKSSLINFVFKKDIATVGVGKPCTKGIPEAYENEYVTLYDSEGYETGEDNQRNYNNMIFDFLEDKDHSPETAIHIIWYCIRASSARFTDVDAQFINKIFETKRPIAIVLTQIDEINKEDFKALCSESDHSCPDVPVFWSSKNENISLPNGLDELQNWSLKQLPDAFRRSFIAASNRDLDVKEEEGKKIVMQMAVAASAVGASPIPFSDAPLLVADQMAMLARLSLLWDLGDLKNQLAAGGIVELVMTNLGKSFVGNLIKFFPGIGTVAGGVINATVAGGLTYALGMAVNTACRKYCDAQLEGKSVFLEEYFNLDILKTVTMLFNQYKEGKM